MLILNGFSMCLEYNASSSDCVLASAYNNSLFHKLVRQLHKTHVRDQNSTIIRIGMTTDTRNSTNVGGLFESYTRVQIRELV